MMWGQHFEKKWWTRFLNMLWILLIIGSSVMAKKGMFESKSKCTFFETLFVGIVTPSWIKFDSFFQELYFVSLHMRCFYFLRNAFYLRFNMSSTLHILFKSSRSFGHWNQLAKSFSIGDNEVVDLIVTECFFGAIHSWVHNNRLTVMQYIKLIQ